MSLILEALKKLEKERDTSGRGFVVVAQAPWPARRDRLVRVAVIAVGAGALAGAAAWGAWTLLSSGRSTERAPRAAATSQPGAAPTALPPPIWETAPAAARTAAPAAVPAVAAATPAPAVVASPAPAASATPSPEEPPLLVIAPKATSPLHLEAISSQGGEPVAVINGRLVRKGDMIEGALITWIGADGVEVEIDGKRRVLGF